MSYHGVVYVDMQPLLYPGATQIKGAYKINPFVENEFQEKVKYHFSTNEFFGLSAFKHIYVHCVIRQKEKMA